jgi:two-component system LytT family response regulator
MNSTLQAPGHMIALSAINEYILTTEDNIISCHSSGNYTEVHLEDGRKVVISKTLKDVEKSFRTSWFVRVHHSHLINLKHAIKFLKKDGARLLLDNGNEVMVSRSKRKDLMDRIIQL